MGFTPLSVSGFGRARFFLRPVQPRELLMKGIDKWRGAVYTHYVGRGAA
mgnify:CR=1 FL=1